MDTMSRIRMVGPCDDVLDVHTDPLSHYERGRDLAKSQGFSIVEGGHLRNYQERIL